MGGPDSQIKREVWKGGEMFKDFKAFIRRGNVTDLAVGFIMGAAFGKFVTSLINDIIMPPIGLLLGKVDFSNMYLNLSGKSFESLKQAKEAGAATINYGIFLNTIIEFLVVALAIFIMVRWVNKLRAQPAPLPAVPTNKECPFCFSSIPIKAVRCPACTSELKN
jgi:large conductance mechanosensitive channel